ncbi:hypothetical protein CKM354_000895200 [Cercospora kikuchii]|uniref:BHLH domain-containing protein n=1 Tax=Cercospora kikuchii TaxID=84275 RepID=A0A9P3CNP9_9PEZI|nr:uncharacterized protein CKM354_000895200 [Cercospora kikuchii]GIZ45801.1 hypothetical protein CKM354_000895200 [Cercospora kikuchii]
MNPNEFADLGLPNDSMFNDFSVDNLFTLTPTSEVNPQTGDGGTCQLPVEPQFPQNGNTTQDSTADSLAIMLDTVDEQAILDYLKTRGGVRPASQRLRDGESKASQRPSPVPSKRRDSQLREGPAAATPGRPHYAVEKRYRSALNTKYAKLTDAVLQDSTQRICQAANPEWNVHALEGGNRLNKKATLSAALDTIDVLVECCERKAGELEDLEKGRQAISAQARELVGRDINSAT